MFNLPERILNKFTPEPNTGCWLWDKNVTHHGYPNTSYKGKPWRVHRLVYTLLIGPIPAGLVLDHKCNVITCVNPDHLEPKTQYDNIKRAKHRRFNLEKIVCPRGHPYSEENTYTHELNGYKKRSCRICKMECKRRLRKG